MKNRKLYIIILLACIVVSFLLGWKCALRRNNLNTTPQTIVETVVQYDTTKIESVVYTPIPYKEVEYINQIDTVFLSQEVDTLGILQEFMTTYYYADTIKNDTSAFIAIYDEVLYNRIWRRNWEFINRRPTHIQTTINQYPTARTWNIGVGGVVSGNSSMLDYGIGVHVRNKRINYMVNYIISDKSIQGGIYYDFLR